MKKLIFSTLLAIMAIFSSNAQTNIKYNGEINLGYGIGVGDFSAGRVNLHTIQGVKIGDYFSTGVGVGFDYYHEGDELIVPIYLNLKGYYPINEKVSPFVSFDLGYGIGATDDLSGLGGLYISPTVGIKYRHISFQLGYTCQRLQEEGVGIDFGAVQFKVGYVF